MRARLRLIDRIVGSTMTIAFTVAALIVFDPAAGEAVAYSSSVSMRIISSGCSSSTWRGAISNSYTKGYWPTYKAQQSSGSVRYCTTKLRAADANDEADYYVLDSVASWSNSARSNFHLAAPWSQKVSSSVAARRSEYSATPSFFRSTGTVNFSIGASFAGISLSSPQSFRLGTQVTRAINTTRGASWKGADASKVSSTELIYAQAVAENTVPKYTVTYSRPAYSYSWSRVKQCRATNCWTGWKPQLSGAAQSQITHTR